MNQSAIIQLKFSGPTGSKGSRIRIKGLASTPNFSKTIPWDHKYNRMHQMAADWMQRTMPDMPRNYSYASGDNGDEYMVFSDHMAVWNALERAGIAGIGSTGSDSTGIALAILAAPIVAALVQKW